MLIWCEVARWKVSGEVYKESEGLAEVVEQLEGYAFGFAWVRNSWSLTFSGGR